MFINRNKVLVASLAVGLRKLCKDPTLSEALEIGISNVRLTDIPDEVFSAKRLQSLRILQESRLKLVSPRIKELSELRELTLSQNSLEVLPTEMRTLIPT